MAETMYRKGKRSEDALVEVALEGDKRLVIRAPASKGTADVMVVEVSDGVPRRHTVWLINCKRNDWAPPHERLALALLATRHGAIGVLARHNVEGPGHAAWFAWRGVRANGDMTDEWQAPPWDL